MIVSAYACTAFKSDMTVSGLSVYSALVASSSDAKSVVLFLSPEKLESKSGAIAMYHCAAISSAI